MKVAIIGGGAMGTAMVAASFKAGVLEPATTVVCEIVPERREELERTLGVKTAATAADAVAGADAAILAVKPQDLGSVGIAAPGALVLSIMAGVRIDTIRQATGATRIVRIMPNTPAMVGAGMAAWTATAEVSETDRDFVGRLLRAMGAELYVADEGKIDIATAINGSGPGYVFLLMEAMVDGAVAAGLARDHAELLVRQTFLGSALYARETGRNLAELRAQVTSPGGTTAAGLSALESHGVRAAIIEAVEAAYRRARALGGE